MSWRYTRVVHRRTGIAGSAAQRPRSRSRDLLLLACQYHPPGPEQRSLVAGIVHRYCFSRAALHHCRSRASLWHFCSTRPARKRLRPTLPDRQGLQAGYRPPCRLSRSPLNGFGKNLHVCFLHRCASAVYYRGCARSSVGEQRSCRRLRWRSLLSGDNPDGRSFCCR